jgi:protein SPT2
MRAYDREERHPQMEDEYEDYDDSGYGYEEEGDEEEGEEEEYEEEDPNLSKERLEYLAYRQRVKERIRKQRKKEGGSGPNNSYGDRKKLPYDNYGSFFGPSQPVIASRVIQESKSLLENQHLTPQLSNALHPRKKSPSSSSALAKPGVHSLKPKVVNEVKTKVQKLKDTRDYSFLMDDDAEIPAPAKVPPQRNVSAPNSGFLLMLKMHDLLNCR